MCAQFRNKILIVTTALYFIHFILSAQSSLQKKPSGADSVIFKTDIQQKNDNGATKFIPVKCTIIDAVKGLSINKMPMVTDEIKGKTIQVKPLKTPGAFEFLIEKNKNYKIECNVTGYKNFDLSVNISRYIKGEENEYEIKLIPFKTGDFFTLKNIYFYPNTPVFMNESNKQLEELYSFMKNHPEAKISIEGHTNSNRYIKGEKQYAKMGGKWSFKGSAKKLSKYRSKEVKVFLVKRGIEDRRVETKGYGGSREIYPDTKNLDESLKNMRVEVYIIKI